ncbi:RloB family protein [Treponema sp.]|uniref:RloB family protein n=1 Tax=Treponema sp. TaxID=166 RepID=UPI0025F28D92|nr:RloB family protein [Treponema sp.]MBR4322242.1 RloB domain-containing protein [Treponema sp.]
MARGKNGRRERKMKPVILVLCEGETEECYVEHLKQKYRLPIKIISKIVGQQINQKLINRYKKELEISSKENIDCFLIYDADVQSVVENISQCDAKVVLSRPCIEVWFLAHSEKVFDSDFSSDECLRRLGKITVWENYKKGTLSASQKNLLWEKRLEAVGNISHIVAKDKIFSTIDEFMYVLEKNRRN